MTASWFAGRNALVTGASSGIGAKVAERLAERGASTVLVGRDDDRLRAVAQGLHSTRSPHRTVVADLTSEHGPGALAAVLAESGSDLEVLVHCAGVFDPRPFEELTVDDLDWVWAVNARAAFLVTQVALAHLSDGAAIVFVTSVSAHIGMAGQSAYAMSKSAIEGLSRVLAVELAPRRIRVNSVAPGYIATPMNARFRTDAGFAEQRANAALAGRLGSPDDIAEAIIFLVSPKASYITGTTLHVDGGYPTAGVQRGVRR